MSRTKSNTTRKLYRRAVRIRSLEPFGIERGDVAILARDADIRTGELGFFTVKHDHRNYNQFMFVCEGDHTCYNTFDVDKSLASEPERVCLRSDVRKCNSAHAGELFGRVVAVERKGLSVETTLDLRPVDEYTAPPPSTAAPKRTPPTFRLNDLHHETALELFWQFDASPEAAKGNMVVKYPTHILYSIEARLNNLAHQYALDRETLTKEKIYLAACRSRYVQTKGVTSHNNDIDGIICTVMRQRMRAPRKPEPPKSRTPPPTRTRHDADDEKRLEELRRKLHDLDESGYPREGEQFGLEKEIEQLENSDEWPEII